MKKTLLFLTFLTFGICANAQYTVSDRAGNLLSDGDVLNYSTLDFENSSYQYYVTNTSGSNINMRIEFLSAENSTGSGFEVCFGQCYTGIAVGQTIPEAPEFVTLTPGEVTLDGNHFYNFDAGNGTDILNFVFRFYQVEDDGVTETGTPLTFTYRYTPLLATQDFNKLNVSLNSTLIDREMTVNAVEGLDLSIYSIQGKLVKTAKIEAGRTTIDVSDLASQVYLVKFNNNQGVTETIKVVIK